MDHWADEFRYLYPFDCYKPGWNTTVEVSGLNPVRLDSGQVPSIAGVENRSQLFLIDRMRTSNRTSVTEAQQVEWSVVFGYGRQTRHVAWSLVTVECVQQTAVQHRLKPTPPKTPDGMRPPQ
jgi:hypothetical protein